MNAPLLEVEGLSVELRGRRGPLAVLQQVGFRLQAGQALGIVGESGGGKTMLALAILRLLPESLATVISGQVRFRSRDLLALDPAALRALRGRELAMVFQEPMTALNPLLPVGRQLGEVLPLHRGLELLELLGVPEPAAKMASLPTQLSKGIAQRVLLAMALAGEPALLVADEPTASLDAARQTQVLSVLAEAQKARGMGLILIAHDLSVVEGHVDHVLVMQQGRAVEWAPTAELFANPQHPYTQQLLRDSRRLRGARAHA